MPWLWESPKTRFCPKLTSTKKTLRNCLAVQWLGIPTSTEGGVGSTPSWGTKILHAMRCGQKKERKKKKTLRFRERLSHVFPLCHWFPGTVPSCGLRAGSDSLKLHVPTPRGWAAGTGQLSRAQSWCWSPLGSTVSFTDLTDSASKCPLQPSRLVRKHKCHAIPGKANFFIL